MIHSAKTMDLYHSEYLSHMAIDQSPDVLTAIYEDRVNFAVWERDLSPSLQLAVNGFIHSRPHFQASMTLTPDNALEHLIDELSHPEHGTLIAQDMAKLIEMFCCLFELERVGLRMSVLTRAMCPRFHVDHVPCRLVTTYQGKATQWLPNQAANRSKLGRGNGGLPDHESGLYTQASDIHQLNTGDVALLKGESWEGNEGAGLIHRSPEIDENRLMLTLDFNA